ncbi:A disintegrin and metalloproteinase with thrombospondin motifs 7 [Saguinus oedipus]|uniref:A disintegrin and metalloproteinase with thrombospondin motifs 7 n=1 Tax=Saguinus oedipus TaxID=9490 RepID=A0ABQ9V6W3_SAGOE|nr:A disintegrin and metalloproteinase with thrombospondin motifs 7 [Saguinus oedipus]
MLYEGQLHTCVPVVNDVNPCKLHCQPSNEYFAEKLWDAVVDGTLCYQGRVSWDLCINGICKNVGCDFEIDSGAMEDHYGMCHDNGSTCHTVSGTLEEAKGLGYVDVGLVPAGPHEICIQEVAEAANFLALQSEDLKYFFNGGWTIQWDADYQVAGTTFTYACRGNWENLTSLGHTKEPVWIQGSLDDTEANVLVLVASETPDMARAMTHTILSHLAEPQTQAQHQHQGQQEQTEHPSTCGQGILLQVAAYAEHVHVSRVPHGCCPYRGI